MIKHLRKFFSLLAIMLALSFSWGSAQNLSSAKMLLTFGFETTFNSELQTDISGVINQANRTVAITVPYATNVTALKATFTSSEFSKVFFGANPTLGILAVSNITSWNYTQPVTLTVQAENLSYENYVVTISTRPPSTENSILTFSGAWAKNWTGPCEPNGTFLQTEPGTISGDNITFPVPFGARLDDLTVRFTISPYATCNFTSFTAQDFDIDNNGIPEAKIFVVTSQSGVAHNYSVLPIVGPASIQDNLLSFIVPNAVTPAVVNYNTQNITAVVPYSATIIAPVWAISPYAHMFSESTLTNEICSGTSFPLTGDVTVLHFWVQAELKSEVSDFTLTVTKDIVKTGCDLISIDANYSKVNLCGVNYTGNVLGVIGTNTITFNVPYGVNSLTIHGETFSLLARTSDPIGTVLNSSNNTIVITAEDGITTKTYSVIINAGVPSNTKQILTFGFNKATNTGWGFSWPDSIYSGSIDQNLKRINVIVPYNTNLYQLRAYFTSSIYSCVSIAESNGTFTPQISDFNINNYSNALTYVVTAEDGTQERYEVIVSKIPAKTGNDLIDFKLTLTDCFGVRYIVPGVYTDNNITVSVKYGTNLSTLFSSFVISDGATSSRTSGVIDLTNPINIIITSESGVSKTYTVTAVVRPENSEKKLLNYWFDSDNNRELRTDIIGTINETSKTIELLIPTRIEKTNLVASFVTSDGSVLTHNNITQVNGVTVNDFITPVVYTVWAENCSFVEYFVIVNYGTGVNDYTLENRINVYPNPVDDKFTISFINNKSTDMKIQMINASGQVVYYNELKNIQNHDEQINITSFSKGIYYLKINDGSEMSVKKIVLQ